ncbi:DNA cytosine methyltransferase [Hespellia stercorisuis]|uniref:DNA (cytosine-5-)-methyltransferase n=1 Tax=Hespellia stercorisuis DSM 15480 TaxID=1121950 RepID=A0A1M6VRW4_9FIRM|nr:DNA cytosine methyltransferase [Hespellia stercorisuis]SHK84124.1 DNA (cytosine-5)-methyltransferase 1 [Hespellia stercorisuis DSM 15480]
MKNLKRIASESCSEWNKEDFRSFKKELVLEVQKKLNSFTKLSFDDYGNNRIQIIDLFCGAGGTSLGFAAVNSVMPAFKFLGGCDINRVSAETYSYNYGTTLLNRDILEIAYDNSKLETFLKEINYNASMPLILIGCAPCQGFSSHRKKHWDEEDDNRNSLIIAFSKIVERIKPDAILMENVPEFLSKKYWEYFSTASKNFVNNGYVVKQNIYNAASFGVPQERFRSIVIGMKKEFLLPEGYLDVTEFKTVRDAIGNLPSVKAGEICDTDSMHKSIAHKESTIEVIKQVPHDGGNRPAGIGPKCLDRTKGFSDVYGRLFWDKPSITITHYARNPASGRFIHPEQDRGLTAREAALLQSFPRGFEFTGKSDDIYRQIGEAVPPMLSAAVAVDILVELISVQPTEEEKKNGVQSIEQPVSSSYSSVIAGIKMKRE